MRAGNVVSIQTVSIAAKRRSSSIRRQQKRERVVIVVEHKEAATSSFGRYHNTVPFVAVVLETTAAYQQEVKVVISPIFESIVDVYFCVFATRTPIGHKR